MGFAIGTRKSNGVACCGIILGCQGRTVIGRVIKGKPSLYTSGQNYGKR